MITQTSYTTGDNPVPYEQLADVRRMVASITSGARDKQEARSWFALHAILRRHLQPEFIETLIAHMPERE